MITLTIGGEEYLLKSGSLDISEIINGVGTASGTAMLADPADRFTVGAEIVVTRGEIRVFAGWIQTWEEESFGGDDGLGDEGIWVRFSAADYGSYLTRRYLQGTIVAGTLKAQLTQAIAAGLSGGPITLSADQGDGPANPELVFPDSTLMRDAIQTIVDAAGATGAAYVWAVDYDGALEAFQSAAFPAPFAVSDTDTAEDGMRGDLTVEVSLNESYANYLYVRAGTGQAMTYFEWLTDGVATSWTGDLPAALNVDPPNLLLYGPHGSGGHAPLGPYEPALGAASIWLYQWDPITHTVYQRAGDPPHTAGEILAVDYVAQYPFTVIVQDAAAIALYGRWEAVVEAPEAFSVEAAEAFGQAYLARFTAEKKQVRYRTWADGLVPGMAQPIQSTLRNLDADCLIMEIRTIDPESGDGDLEREVLAIVGETPKAGWREKYLQWADTGGAPAAVQAGSSAGGALAAPPRQSVQFNRDGQFGGSAAFLYHEAEHSLVCGALSSIDAVAFESCQVFGYDCHIADP